MYMYMYFLIAIRIDCYNGSRNVTDAALGVAVLRMSVHQLPWPISLGWRLTADLISLLAQGV